MSQYEDLDEPRLATSHSFQAHRRGVPAPPSLDLSDGGSSGSFSSSGDEQSPQIASANLKTAKPRNMAHHPHPTTTQDLIIPPSISAKLQSQLSPCFVHSHLADVAYTDIANRKSPVSIEVPPVHETLAHLVEDPKDSKSPRTPTSRRPSNAKAVESPGGQDEGSDGSSTEGESDDGSSLTRKLAETAVSVREMSKQLGRALVKTNVNSVLIITKARDNQLTRLTREMALWIMTQMKSGRERGVIVYVDAQLKKSKRFDAAGIERDYPNLFKPVLRRYSRRNSSTSLPNDSSESRRVPASKSSRNLPSSPARGFTDQLDDQQGQLRYWTAEMCTKSPQLFDFVITLGGDGTVLFASWLFQRIVPPIIPFALGSLGFLTNFDYSQFRKVLNTVTQEGVRVNLRMRFTCTVFRAVETETKRRAVRSGKTGEIFMADLESGDWDVIESGGNTKRGSSDTDDKDREVLCFSTRPVEEFEVINDLVVDRGPSPYVSLLELFGAFRHPDRPNWRLTWPGAGDEHHMTTVQADGLCVATPTGSTAYSLSAGGSLVSPESPAILVTPICPHTLSFRPILLPDSMELRICVPYNSRSTAWASFDGRGRVELRQGDHIRVRASTFPFPTVCRDKQSTDWFHSIARTLKWNERQRQKSFVMVEEQRASEPDVHASKAALSVPAKDAKSSPLAREATDEDEPETFDIDDLSGTDSTTSAPDSPSELERPLQHKATDTSTADSITDDESRFSETAPRPHPPKVSQRHSYQTPNGTSSTARDGETGDRDHILDRAPYVSKKKRIPRHLKLTPSNEVSPPPPTVKRSGDLTKLERHRSETAPAHRRAFAIYGDDESDTSISDLSEG